VCIYFFTPAIIAVCVCGGGGAAAELTVGYQISEVTGGYNKLDKMRILHMTGFLLTYLQIALETMNIHIHRILC
jgi:hypothetical protein